MTLGGWEYPYHSAQGLFLTLRETPGGGWGTLWGTEEVFLPAVLSQALPVSLI